MYDIMTENKFVIIQSDWVQNFRVINFQDATERGVCYGESKQVWISLHLHESITDIVDTINHESLHQAIKSDFNGMSKDSMDMGDTMDGEQEHELMKRVTWNIHDWVDFDRNH